jgi:hypothetical protein
MPIVFQTDLKIKIDRNPCTFQLSVTMKMRGFSPNVHIHVSVGDLYIPWVGPHISLQQKRQTDPGN